MPIKDPEARRAYHRKYMREVWYPKNREKHQRLAKASRARGKGSRQELVWQHLLDHPCMDCGESDPVVLEFDHRPAEAKVRDVSELVHRGTLSDLKLEMAKCDVVCANCHRRRTANRLGTWKLERRGKRLVSTTGP